MLTVKSEEASPPNFTKHNLITLVDVLSETILGDEWLISGDIPMEVERSLRTLLSHLKSDLHAFTEHLFSDERVYGTALQLKEQITQAPVVLRFIKCLSRIMLGVDIKATSFILVLDIFRIWTSDRVAATFMSNPEIGIVDLFMQLALTSQDNDRLLHCLCEITKLSRVKNFTYRINKNFWAKSQIEF
ncbi:hypothetical protein BC829DRAFT_298436 [Chytridium lagenaria]|nr:hypothetical protein BC829DRAFT_298436 [Chytridium lagenaria]